MDEQAITVVLVGDDSELRAEAARRLAGSCFTWLEASNPSEAATLPLHAHQPVFAMIGDAPAASDLQHLLDLSEDYEGLVLCLPSSMDDAVVQSLMQMGVQDIVPRPELSAERLRSAVLAARVREQRYRLMRKRTLRLALKWQFMAAIAASDDPHQILGTLADGLLALGAQGAGCFQREGQDLREVAWRGARVPSLRSTDLLRESFPEPLRRVEQGTPGWHMEAEGGSSTRSRRTYGFIPVSWSARRSVFAVAVYPALLSQVEHRLEVQGLAEQVGAALERAQRLVEVLRDRDGGRRLLAVVGHDLRNPLATIALSVDLLAVGLPDSTRESIQRIRRSLQVATRLTQDLLAFSRITGKGLELQRTRFDLFSLLRHAVDTARHAASEGRTLRTVACEGDGWIMADEVRIEQAVGNLLSNALTYSPEGGEITVRAAGDVHAIYVEVDNRGASLDRARVAELFAPLIRLSRVGEHGSQGLGLFIVERILSAHGGRVWAEPFAEDGLRVCLQLPRDSAPNSNIDFGAETNTEDVPWPAARPLPAALTVLSRTFQHEVLREVLLVWSAARKLDDRLPHPDELRGRALLGYLPHLVWAHVVQGPDGNPVFEWLEVGPRLEQRLGGPLVGAGLSAGEGHVLPSHYEAYLRCCRRREPVYDYARHRGPDGFMFERLLLPLSRGDSGRVTDIIGLVVIDEIGTRGP